MMPEFSPFLVYQQALRRWWVIVLCILTGGGIGLLVHSLQPPIYEAEANLVLSLDFPPNEYLTQYEEDYALGTAAAQIMPVNMASVVIEELSAHGYSWQTEEFIQHASLERKQSSWYLRVRQTDPDLAVLVARTWVMLAYDKLVDAHLHALQADLLQDQMYFLLRCNTYALISQRVPSFQPPQAFQGQCGSNTIKDLRAILAATGDLFRQELVLSRGVTMRLMLDLPDVDTISVYRVAFDRNLLVLAGALVGFLMGAWLVNLLPAARGRRA